eukprot:gene17203-23524_t
MLGRPDWEAPCRLPIAAVPTGSGNGMAASSVPTGSGNGMATSCGMWDPTTAAHAICKGRTEPLDMATVLQAPGSRYLIFLSVVFGLMANLDIGTEWMRWMGEARFTLGGLKEVILAKKYAMRVAYLPESSMAPNNLQALACFAAANKSHASVENPQVTHPPEQVPNNSVTLASCGAANKKHENAENDNDHIPQNRLPTIRRHWRDFGAANE